MMQSRYQQQSKRRPVSVAYWMATVSAAMIALMPFHALLTVWLTSVTGHYTAVRLWKEYLVVLLLLAGIFICTKQPVLRRRLRSEPLMAFIGLYLFLLVLKASGALAGSEVNLKAAAYGVLLDARFLVFFAVTWLVSQQHDMISRFWHQLLLIPAAVVAVVATLQFWVLPADILRHFGYGSSTIAPVETVDQKAAYQRVQSTLRGANPLGAYLVISISAAAALVLRATTRQKAILPTLIGLFSLVALIVSFSRSAWIGTTLAIGGLIWLVVTSESARRLLLVLASTLVLVCAAVGYSLRDNDRFQNAFFHTDEHSLAEESSNSGRLRALQNGARDIMAEPLGRGTGTAGPASVYNGNHPSRIAENYYLQLGQEVGIIGLGLFVLISIMVAGRLWQHRQQALPLVLLVSLLGITAVNMLSHAWTDDTLAYVWWGLAGAALASATPPVGEAGDIDHA